MSTADPQKPAHSLQGTGATMGPETQMLNLKILQNLAQNNIYRDEESKAGIRALEKSLLGQGRRYTPVEAAECAGLPLETAQRIWHNMGFPTIADHSPYFTETDVQMLADLQKLDAEGDIRMEYVASLVRSEGQLTDRTVAWQIEALVHNIMVTENLSDNDARRKLLKDFPRYLDVLERLALYAYRRQMYAGILRLGLRENNVTTSGLSRLPLVRGVGFVDLVSYTSLVRNLDAAALSQLINHFEQSCLDVIAPLGGRIIKTLGDEVFFLTEAPDAIAEISLRLSEKIGADPQLPDARVAFIWGEVLANRGDVYGSSVNLAARLVSLAEPGTVLTDNETANTLRQKLRTGGATHRGAHRENNEDSMVVAGSLCVVADGMGGHESGEVASRLCVRQLAYSPFFTMPGGRSEGEQQTYVKRLAAIDEEDPVKRRRRANTLLNNEIVGALNRLHDILGETNEEIKQALSHAGGTTVTGAWLTNIGDRNLWVIFNVGDSRTYRLLREDEGIHHSAMEKLPGSEGSASLEQVTADHSEVQYLVDEGQITALEALTHPRRNVITRALGTGNYWEPDFWVLPARAGDRLMLCSDGLSGELSHEYMARVLTSIRHPQDAADVLQHEALRSGGRDNITVIVADAVEA